MTDHHRPLPSHNLRQKGNKAKTLSIIVRLFIIPQKLSKIIVLMNKLREES